MWRVTIRVGRVVFVAVLAVVGLVRAQPAPDAPFGAVLVPPGGCEAPCFLGVRPGETDAETAIALLEAHPWTTNVVQELSGAVRWNWSADAPRYLNQYRDNRLLVQRDTQIVGSVTMFIDAPTGLVWWFVQHYTDSNGVPLDAHIRVDGQNCIANPLRFWSAPTQRVYYTSRAVTYDTIYRARRTFRGAMGCDR